MILYITDNPIISKKISGSILLYQIYNWKVEIVAEKNIYEAELMNYNISQMFKKRTVSEEIKLHNEIIAIVARSNYKLIYELQYIEEMLKKKVKIYFWDKWLIKKKIEYIKKIKVNRAFSEYLQRGFLTKLSYEQLSTLNMQRIEQFMVYIALNLIDLELYKEEQIRYREIISPLENSDIDLVELINIISFKKNNPVYIVDKLMYHSRRGDISDPFVGKCKILKESSLSKMIDKGKKEKNVIIIRLLSILGDILPLNDILKTLRFLVKNEMVYFEEGFIDFSIRMEKEEIRRYLPYVSKEKWEMIYSSGDYSFSGIFPSLQFEELNYSCPLCGSSEFRTTPLHFFCTDNLCKFQVDRIITPGGLPKNITDWDLKRLVKYGHTVIKNRLGGYSRFKLVEGYAKNGKYYIIPEIEKNDVGK